jgi:hypothetical protein
MHLSFFCKLSQQGQDKARRRPQADSIHDLVLIVFSRKKATLVEARHVGPKEMCM